ncbi:MAG TPA: hypothetical protein VES73_00290 [Lamprocystis sp. (in: g-proteobacteria)]|nr:hypothetical protein [Lamprocystis sp. (in: g-proteobacteria)]
MQPSITALVVLAVVSLTGSLTATAASIQMPSVIVAARGGGASSPAEAAAQAQRQTGGKVLAVRQTSGGYEVKVLTPSGEVRLVFIPGAGG